jgi:MGT family glycosyltransferase
MARFLFAVWPYRGHFFPTIAIAHALRERGHTAAFYSGAAARSIIEAEGFECFPFVRIDESRLEKLMFAPDRDVSGQRPLRAKKLLRAWLIDTIPQQVEDLARILDDWQPDLIVSETSMWGPILVLHETYDIPVAVFSTVASCMLPGPGAPPFGLGLPRLHGLPARALAALARPAGSLLAANFRRAANAVRAQYRLPPLSISVTQYTGRMPLYLMPSLPEFDYQRQDLPPSVRYIGPCIWNSPRDEPAPPWLRQLSRERPWVHVSEGTVQSQSPFLLRAAAQGLANLPIEIILTTGGNREPSELDLGVLAPNIHTARWLPHCDLLPYTNVLVTTGGAGTVMTALHAGVPLVVVPTEWDKPENAQRVVDAGVGVRLSPRRCTPARLRAAVEQVLSDPTFHSNARRMSELIANYDGPALAAEQLEQLTWNASADRSVSMA